MVSHVTHPSVTPIAELSDWAVSLHKTAQEPLRFAPSFPAAARRHEAWWGREAIDRPLFLASGNANPARPITRRLELIESPAQWFEAKLADLEQTRWIGDALPNIRTDFGPVLLGGMLGGRLEFGADTGWTHPFIDDEWSNAPNWELHDDNKWYRLQLQLTELVARDAPGRYLVCTPDFGGSADVLLNLRGSGGLCTDVYVQPDRLRAAIDSIYPAWRKVFTEVYRIVMNEGAGLFHWLGLWSDRPYLVPACDFNFMIGPEPFNELCLPDIARQSETVGRAVFHLDGPGAARHIDALLEVSSIQAIQFTPGQGTPSALAWLEMLQKIQQKGRSLLIFCPVSEVLELIEHLRPEGLAIQISDCGAVDRLEATFQAFRTHYGAAN